MGGGGGVEGGGYVFVCRGGGGRGGRLHNLFVGGGGQGGRLHFVGRGCKGPMNNY